MNKQIQKNILSNSDLAAFINTNFQFYPILDTAKKLERISSLFKKSQLPCFMYFRWDLENDLKLIKLVKLSKYSTPDMIMDYSTDVLELAEKERIREMGLFGQIEKKKVLIESLKKQQEKQIDQIFNNKMKDTQRKIVRYVAYNILEISNKLIQVGVNILKEILTLVIG